MQTSDTCSHAARRVPRAALGGGSSSSAGDDLVPIPARPTCPGRGGGQARLPAALYLQPQLSCLLLAPLPPLLSLLSMLVVSRPPPMGVFPWQQLIAVVSEGTTASLTTGG
ncbi:hypothetical protein HPB50_018379 [Hyalomma asiaticum]|uniref:Uncharacterized protein n=1 Tax=Hyalomma asiaticum TaxID=266040 RepID=A0ACB7TM66_HYAAI|nr:hypothetical protein HPB50_018379 [Hyalomma asiaticum]